MNAAVGPDWLDQHVLPEIQNMLVQDAYFKLMGYARQLTGEFNGAVAGLIYAGYITSQTVAIRRLCDNRRDVISLGRVLEEARKTNPTVDAKAGYLSQKLDACRSIGDLVDNYIGHTGNPQRRPNMPRGAYRSSSSPMRRRPFAKSAMILARDLLRDYIEVMPVVQSGDIMGDFGLWVPAADIQKLWNFWHDHRATVNSWRW